MKVQSDLFIKHNLQIPRSLSKVALDLGCGSGFQSIALEKLGYNVHAVDFSEPLLQEIRERSSTIKTYAGDLTDLSFAASLSPELIVCMGDTLTHLAAKEAVYSLIFDSFKTLAEGGALMLTYRDLSRERGLLDRFIPVKSDDTRILTCFLEDIPDQLDKVRVFDLLYERNASSSQWELKKSHYEKLKLPASIVIHWMESAGFKVHHERTASGLEIVIGRKHP